METPSLPPLITYSSTPPRMVPLKESKHLAITVDSSSPSPLSEVSITSHFYYWMTAKASVGVSKGNWYWEVKVLKGKGSCRLGWCTEKFIGEDGIGGDEHSWSFDPSQSRKYHKSDDGSKYGQTLSKGDILGCQLDFDQRRIIYYKNGVSLGVAYGSLRLANTTLYPCVSILQDTVLSVNLGKNLAFLPLGASGLNTTLTNEEKKSVMGLFDKYSGGEDVIANDHLLRLAEDLGSTGPMDPTLLITAWILNSTHPQWNFHRLDWTVSLSLQKIYSLSALKAHLDRIKREVSLTSKPPPDPFGDVFKNFYLFVFDYLKQPKASWVEKGEAIVAWKICGLDKCWGLFDKWEKYIEAHQTKSISRDTWIMLLRFVEKLGQNLDNYDDNDSWPTLFDEFVKLAKKE